MQSYETCTTHAISNWGGLFSSAGRICSAELRLHEREYSVPTIPTTGHINIEGFDQTVWVISGFGFIAVDLSGIALLPAVCRRGVEKVRNPCVDPQTHVVHT